MELQLTTPALLFSTISLLLLAFTNRFLATAQVVRNLYEKYQVSKDEVYVQQINNLRYRLRLTRNMQFFLVISLLLSVVCMFLLFAHEHLIAQWVFGFSLMALVYSLILSSIEIFMSTQALEFQLQNIEEKDMETKGIREKISSVFQKQP